MNRPGSSLSTFYSFKNLISMLQVNQDQDHRPDSVCQAASVVAASLAVSVKHRQV
jgi:hypothetical protein